MRACERDTSITTTLILAAVVVISPALFAQSSGQPARTPLDITGTWQQVTEKTMFRWTELNQDPPLQPWALEMYKKAREGKRLDERGDGWLDPETYCLPWGTPRLWTSTAPTIIVEAPGRVIMIQASEFSPLPRLIYTDGRDHPEGFPPRFDGHSIGRWDRGTFVIDTVALDPDTWIDDAGTPHSDALHIVERLRRVNLTTLEVSVEFDDPKAFTRRWTGIKKTLKMYPDWEYIPGIPCEDRFHLDFQKKTPRAAEDRVVVPR